MTTALPVGFRSYGRVLSDLARTEPNRPAVIASAADGSEAVLSRRQLVERAVAAAHLFQERGVEPGSWVAVALPNTAEHVIACSGAWLLGACVLPLSPSAPAAERDQHLDLAAPRVVVADWVDVKGTVTGAELTSAEGAAPLPDVVADPGKAIGTGGSTGRPKLIVNPGPWGHHPGADEVLTGFGVRPDQVQLLPGPLHHNFGFDWCYQGLLRGHTVVIMERFDAARAVGLIERHRVQYAGLVPTMMRRIAQLPGISSHDLSSVQKIIHSAGPCPAWVKRAWFELIGAERLIEGYGASEGYGNTVISGDEWLERPGSVGQAFRCELEIRDEEGRPVPPGVVGEVWMRRPGVGDRYIGDERARLDPEGFGSVGDLAHLDEDGYLYLADRRSDLIISGGVNVYPAEVENALSNHPAVADVAVVGLPDDEWGRRVHAIVQLMGGWDEPDPAELVAHARKALPAYKAPKSFEFVPALPRDDGGKLRRAALLAERVSESAL